MPIVLLIYFFNSFLLPHGLLYSALLTPVFIYWIWKYNSLRYLILPALAIVLFDIYHLSNGADLKSLTVSSGLFISAISFCIVSWNWLTHHTDLKSLMSGLLKWNSLFVLLALVTLPFALGRTLLWYEVPISQGIASFPRLKLFTYEAAFYAFLFAPIFLYYFWCIILGIERNWLMITMAIFLPLVLSLSFGVTGALALAIGIAALVFWTQLRTLPSIKKTLLYGGSFSIIFLCVLVLVYPENPIFDRLTNIFQGIDTSARGRLFESFRFAFDLANSKSIWLGVGLGQIKILGHDLIINFYQYEGDFADIVRIPNAMGELLATYGIVGVIFKLSLEIYLFFKHSLHTNYFNFSLFLFVFIYQFTGSYLVNTAELLLWTTAIFVRFPELNASYFKSE